MVIYVNKDVIRHKIANKLYKKIKKQNFQIIIFNNFMKIYKTIVLISAIKLKNADINVNYSVIFQKIAEKNVLIWFK